MNVFNFTFKQLKSRIILKCTIHWGSFIVNHIIIKKESMVIRSLVQPLQILL